MTHQIDENDLAFIEKRHGKINEWVPCPVDQKTGKINPQVTMAIREDGKFVSVFHVKPIYYETASGHWRPLSEVTLHHGNHKIILNENWWQVHPRFLSWLDKRCKLIGGELLIPSTLKSYPTPYTGIVRMLHESFIPPHIGLTTSTFYPDPDVETTSVDGHHKKEAYGTWSEIRGALSATVGDADVTSGVYVADWDYGGGYRWCYRITTLFDTSSIGDGDTIDSATMSYKLAGVPLTEDLSLTNKSMRIVTTTPASNTSLATTDYPNYGTVAQASDFAVASGSSGVYSDFTLNATGLGNISKTGVTKFGLRHTADTENEEPFDAGTDDYNGWNVVYSADTTGTGNDPKLVVVWTAGTASSIKTINGLAKSSVKTVNGLAIASVKTVNGLA